MPAILLSMVGVFAAVIIAQRWRVRSDRARELRRLEQASADDLAAEARRALGYGFEREEVAAHVAKESGWTDETLLAALRAMHRDLSLGDAARGTTGREGDVFSYYDSGLAGLTEILERRLRNAS